MHLPPAQIKIVVIGHLIPSIKADELRLPGKSCAAYMCSQKMPTVSRAQKASELVQAKQWHLNCDGTTLQQQKKVAFLINGIVFGIQDVPDGSSQVALDALKAELGKISKVFAEYSPDNTYVNRIVSLTSDSASTQAKFTHLLENETDRQIVENKCGMHLGVNLRQAQVKAAARVVATGGYDANDELEREGRIDAECALSCSNIIPDVFETSTDPTSAFNTELESGDLNRDIDLCVHELAKLFGHLGTPEYCHGVSTFCTYS